MALARLWRAFRANISFMHACTILVIHMRCVARLYSIKSILDHNAPNEYRSL